MHKEFSFLSSLSYSHWKWKIKHVFSTTSPSYKLDKGKKGEFSGIFFPKETYGNYPLFLAQFSDRFMKSHLFKINLQCLAIYKTDMSLLLLCTQNNLLR